MSVEIMAMVWRIDMPAMDKVVLLRLADFADADGGSVFPSVARVAAECGVSERHVRGVVGKFQKSGMLIQVRAGGGRNRPSEYRINLPVLKGCRRCSVSEDKPCTTDRVSGGENPAPYAGYQEETLHPTTETLQATTLNPAPDAPNPSYIHQESVSQDGREDQIIDLVASLMSEAFDADQRRDGRVVVAAWLAQGHSVQVLTDAIRRAFAKAGQPIRKPWAYLDQVIKSTDLRADQPQGSAGKEFVSTTYDWPKRRKMWNDDGIWLDSWGADDKPPPGYKFPPHLTGETA